MSKASNLQILTDAGFRVPPFVVIPAALFDTFRIDLPTPPSAQDILNAPLPAPIADQLYKLAQTFTGRKIAVRSSMAGEDSARHSFAGQLDSFLNIEGDAAVLEAIQACWASAYGERALAYRRENKLGGDVVMEVILQEMVPAQVSGVIFSADPVARDPRWTMLSVAAGLGEALVQGEVSGETLRVQRETGEMEGTSELLTVEQIRKLAALAVQIEKHFGTPQDIEFALAGGEIFILQARPITTPIFTERMLWDNSNITESYSGVTTPLTFSVIRSAYAQVYRQALELLGASHYDENVLRNMLAFYNGQVYYQMLNWYGVLSWLPAFEQNRRFMEQMMGVKQSAGQGTRAQAGGWLTLAGWLWHMIGLHRSSEQRVQAFQSNFSAVLAEYQAKDFATMSPHQLRVAYLDLETRVLGQWRAPILTDFFCMIFFGVLRRLSERWLDPGGTLHNDLLAGDGAIESLQPARQVQVLGQQVRVNPALSAVFKLDAAETLHQVRSRAEFAGFHADFERYLQLYGDRCMNELKLEEPNLRDDPLPLIRSIAAAAQHPVELGGDSPVRARAEGRIRELNWFKRPLFRWVLGHARRYVRNRENLRFARSRLFGLLRGILNSLGTQWTQADVLAQPADIYYLAIGEIWDFVEGTAVTQNLSALVALRRAEFEAHHSNPAPLPDRFETFGPPYLDTPRDLLARSITETGNTLQGTGCCSGRVRGRAQVVRSVDGVSDLGGDILVAERTDPGWVFLYPSASAILVERGSPLSHSAIVAREMGKPIIVNIPNLTARVRSGDEIEMDGSKGTVWL